MEESKINDMQSRKRPRPRELKESTHSGETSLNMRRSYSSQYLHLSLNKDDPHSQRCLPLSSDKDTK